MPRLVILEGYSSLVKCNVSMAQITDSDVNRKGKGAWVFRCYPAYESELSPRYPGGGFYKYIACSYLQPSLLFVSPWHRLR
jgi:hypothetical protein